MSNWKKTVIFALIVSVLVIIGMVVFVATEKQQSLSYGAAFDLCMQIITTIGYGNRIPITQAGKIFCAFFAIVSIPPNFYLLKLIGEHMLNTSKHIITKIEMTILHRQPRYLHEKCLLIGIVDINVLVLIGAGMLAGSSAKLTFWDGLWAYVITFTTVGFGDIIPHHDPNSNIDMVFFLPFYYYLGLCVMSCIIQSALGIVDSVTAIRRMFGYQEVQNERQNTDETDENAML